MTALKEFLIANDLRQSDICEYLDLAPSYVSQIVNGRRPLPDSARRALLANDCGWDVECLRQPGRIPDIAPDLSGGAMFIEEATPAPAESTGEVESLKAKVKNLEEQIELVREMLSKEEERSAQYWKLIQQIIDK